MKIIESSIIPFKGFKAINLFGVLFHRKNSLPLKEVDINHEKIHTEQMKEMLFIFFYIWYGFEWLIKLFLYGNNRKAYRAISFEREAYAFQNDLNYIKSSRKHFCWFNLMR